MLLTTYTHTIPSYVPECSIGVVSDLHNNIGADILPLLDGVDVIVIPGDLVNRYRGSYKDGLRFLKQASKLAPVFYAPGNHERKTSLPDDYFRLVKKAGAIWLDGTCRPWEKFWFSSFYNDKDLPSLSKLEKKSGYRVVLCHKPEMYKKHLVDRKVDLVIAGHAHGGQIRVMGHGLFAPGQGLFPRYTKGCYDGKLYVSAGAGNPNHMPRWANPIEVLRIDLRHGQ